ncbi:hypothetical protein L873DRAFT_726199 [Choiromyces venosus 120613-1]|uniref:DUF7909 domain-containing protein n=1 Tax=Choiromyces venosus 120613-1 TaxID=1336337 RepID=A0A3N4JRR4_9PEZI|nr:hypothetical protein L873DRAFT_726199 [Choiromyces venosus 120613-1]
MTFLTTPFLPFLSLSLLLLLANPVSTCTPPSDPPTPTFTAPFSVQVQNTSYPQINNRFLNFWQAGGGDQHLYLSPAGTPVANITLDNGVMQRLPDGALQKLVIRAVINGEYTASDNTTKMFLTNRGDPRALFDAGWGCNGTDDSLQRELVFRGRGTLPGGHICVRLASGNRWEFRYSPPGNTAFGGLCIKVKLALIPTTP